MTGLAGCGYMTHRVVRGVRSLRHAVDWVLRPEEERAPGDARRDAGLGRHGRLERGLQVALADPAPGSHDV